MGRKKKPRRRDVYFNAFVFSDGSAFSCGPQRKPSAKQMKDEGIFVDEDFVFKELKYGSSDWLSWPVEQRRELGQIMAIRLNTRRSIRELVLPELAAIRDSLASLHERLDLLETQITKD